jgi:hypothetical protein
MFMYIVLSLVPVAFFCHGSHCCSLFNTTVCSSHFTDSALLQSRNSERFIGLEYSSLRTRESVTIHCIPYKLYFVAAKINKFGFGGTCETGFMFDRVTLYRIGLLGKWNSFLPSQYLPPPLRKQKHLFNFSRQLAAYPIMIQTNLVQALSSRSILIVSPVFALVPEKLSLQVLR